MFSVGPRPRTPAPIVHQKTSVAFNHRTALILADETHVPLFEELQTPSPRLWPVVPRRTPYAWFSRCSINNKLDKAFFGSVDRTCTAPSARDVCSGRWRQRLVPRER
ncbi:hypothetical protein PI125_g16862 [Phytophthora idaei]|nr:hypothetical protein PI125_g16862 [Phytophthora idaei]